MAVLACVPLLLVPMAVDRTETPRVLLLGLAVAVAALAHMRPLARPVVTVGGFLFAYATLAVASAIVNGPASAVFGVHGRFQGLTSLLAVSAAGLIGVLVLARRLRLFSALLAATTVVQAAVVIGQSLAGAEPTGLLGNRVPAGAALAVGAGVALAAGLIVSGRPRSLYLAAAGLATVAVGLTASRGAWLALAAGAVVALAVAGVRPSRIAIIVAVLVAALSIGVLADPVAREKLQPATLLSGSSASRWQIWRGTAAMIADNPLLGVGPGRFLYEFQRFEPFEHALAEGLDVRADQAHSLPLHVAAENGAPSALLAVGLAVFALASGVRGIRRRDGVASIAAAGFAAYCAQALFGVPSMGVDVIGWALGGVLVSRWTPGVPTAGAGRPWVPAMSRGLVAVLGIALVALSGWYLAADLVHARALALYQAADFVGAVAAEDRAIAMNPLVDVYRVGRTDAAEYVGGDALAESEAILAEGIGLEPDSYDLLLARARLYRLMRVPEAQVATAFAAALDVYPYGLTVNVEAAQAFRAAGLDKRAAAADGVVRRLTAGIAAREDAGS